MTTILMTSRSMIMSAVAFALTLSGTAFAESGHVLFVLGQAQVVHADGIALSAVKGLEVETGDTIKTENNGQVQLKMTDGGMISVRPNSQFKIDDYVYSGDVKKDKTIYRLLKGGFRSITGKVGEKNKAAYAVKTSVATIGIRGTDYNARLCEFDCTDVGINNGLYVNVLTGGVVLTNDAGNIVIGPTENGFVSDSWTSPTYLDQLPAELFFAKKSAATMLADNATSAVTTMPVLATTQTLATVSGDQTNTTSFKLVSTAAGNTTTSTVDNTTSSLAVDSTSSTVNTATSVVVDNTSTNTTTSGGTSSTTSTTTVVTAPNTAYVGLSMNTGASRADSTSSILETEMAMNTTTHELTKFATKQLVSGVVATTSYDIGTAVNTHVGYDATTGVSWGIWTNGTVNVTHSDGSVTTNTLGTNDNLHWISTSANNVAMALPSSGTATYKPTATSFTPTTDNFGNTGALNIASTSLTADFSAQTVSADVSTTMNDPVQGSVTWAISKSGMAIVNGQFEGSTNIVTNDHILNNSTTNSGHIAGGFTQPVTSGSAPQGAVLTYSASGDNGEATYTTIQGVALLQRQ